MDEYDERREQVKERYGFASWLGREAAGPARFAADPHQLPRVRFEERVAMPGGRTYIDYLTHEQPGGRIAVTIAGHADAVAAQEALIDVLAHSMALRLPSCGERGIEVGDVCFCTAGEPLLRIYFVRVNVLVRVESVGEVPVSVTDVAAAVDAQIRAAR